MAGTTSPCGSLTEARLLILISLLGGPRHGYGMMKDVHMLGNSKIRLTNGTLYGALRELKSGGLIEMANGDAPSVSKRRKQPYRLTDSGKALLVEQVALLRYFLKLAEERGA